MRRRSISHAKLSPLVPLTHAALLNPFFDFLSDGGVSLYPRLEAAGLPARSVEEPALVVGTHAQMVFVRNVAFEQGIEDFGWAVGGEPSVDAFGPHFQKAVLGASTPYSAMRRLSQLAQSESTGVEIEVDPTAVGVRVLLKTTFPASSWYDHDHASYWQVHTVIEILRRYLGDNWHPLDVGIATRAPIPLVVRSSLEGVPIGQSGRRSWIHIDGNSLARGARWLTGDVENSGVQRRILPQDDVASIRAVLKPFLAEGKAHIDRVAELAGLSRRTLQRRLSKEGHSFSELLEALRYDLACDMLRDDGARIIDIAMELGYNDASHFSRAFRRITGVSPTHFRRVGVAARQAQA